jgi:hypothetical protein
MQSQGKFSANANLDLVHNGTSGRADLCQDQTDHGPIREPSKYIRVTLGKLQRLDYRRPDRPIDTTAIVYRQQEQKGLLIGAIGALALPDQGSSE